MCSRRARIRPSFLDETSSISPTDHMETITSVSPTNDIPNKKRIKNWRRSTGPLSPEDLQMAMLQTMKELENGHEPGDFNGGHNEQIQKLNMGVTDGQYELGNAVKRSVLVVEKPVLTVTIAAEQVEKDQVHPARVKSRHTLVKMDSLLLIESRCSRSPRSSISSDQKLDYVEIDYQKLYENAKYENEMLKRRIDHLESIIHECSQSNFENDKGSIAGSNKVASKDILALQQRLNQLEEEIKMLESLRADNQRLKEENGALIRVISKLSK